VSAVTSATLPLAWPVNVDESVVLRLQQQSVPDSPKALAAHHTTLAWHLRQRDTRRALVLADAAEGLLTPGDHALRARLLLVRAEARWLAADLPGCEALVLAAHAGFVAARDGCGQSDAMALRAFGAFDAGQLPAASECMRQAMARAEAAGDTVRAQYAQAILAFWSLASNIEAGQRHWATTMARFRQSADAYLAMWANNFVGMVHLRQGRPGESIAAFSDAFVQALRAGQVRRAVNACANVAAGYTNLNAHDSALQWSAQALGLARQGGWPLSVGMCLMDLGDSLYETGRLEAARSALNEAITTLQPLPKCLPLTSAKRYLSSVLLQQGEADAAADLAAQALADARQSSDDHDVCLCLGMRAKALLRQGLRQQAVSDAESALQLAERLGSPSQRIDALRVLAEVHAPAPDPAGVARSSLPHLLRLLALAEELDGYIVAPDILQAAAHEHACLGDHAQAYTMMQRANAASDHQQRRAAADRALAMEAHLATSRAQAEATALREKAAADAHRAALFEEANATLQRLGMLGRDITAVVDIDLVFERLYGHLQGLLDVQHLSIWLVDETDGQLRLRFGLEQGQRLAPRRVALDSKLSLAARCVREAREVLHAGPADAQDERHMPGTLRTRSALFGPMTVRGRVIGALSVQAERADAYGERERLVLRSACAWAAIAIDNAAVLAELEVARRQLQIATAAERRAREQAEQATQLKGEFLANVSHDLRTPLASLQGYLETLLLEPRGVSDDDRARYLGAAVAQSGKVNRLAAELMALAQLDTGAMPLTMARFSLSELLVEVVRKLELTVNARSQRVLIYLPRDLPDAVADAGLIERVLTNLLDNAVTHAPQGSEIRIEIAADAREALRVTVLDTGPGIPAELHSSLFSAPSPIAQPHRPGAGGLGLLIVQRLLQQHGCEIRLVQREGYGAGFGFEVPCARG
jgi:signal transduction histidine kinase